MAFSDRPWPSLTFHRSMTLLGQLEHDLELVREDFEARSGGGGGRGGAKLGRNLPVSVEQLVLARQVADRVADVLGSSKLILSDLQGMGRFEAKADDLHTYMSDYQQQVSLTPPPS